MTRKIRQPSRGKASQPYRFGAWQPRVGERIGKGKEKEKVKSWYKVQTDVREVDCRLRQQHAPSLSSSSAASSRRTATRVESDLVDD